MLAVAILAAGESRRMGAPKALLAYRGKTFTEHLMAVTRHPRVGLTKIVLGAGAENLAEKLKLAPEQIVLNENWEQGQLSSIQAAVREIAKEITDGMILCPVDHPALSAEVVAKLIERFDATQKAIALPTFRGKRGHPVIFRASLYDELLRAAPDVGARQVVWAHGDETEEVPVQEEGVILNLNDPDSLKKILEA